LSSDELNRRDSNFRKMYLLQLYAKRNVTKGDEISQLKIKKKIPRKNLAVGRKTWSRQSQEKD